MLGTIKLINGTVRLEAGSQVLLDLDLISRALAPALEPFGGWDWMQSATRPYGVEKSG